MPNHFLGNRKKQLINTGTGGTGGPNTDGPNTAGINRALTYPHTQVFNHIARIANKAATANTTTLTQMAKKLSKLKI
jgi:hypothetical protein